MTITPELKAELLEMLRREMTEQEREKKANKTVFQRIMREYEAELDGFNWTEAHDVKRHDGSIYHREDTHNMAYKIRNAIGALLQAMYKTTSTSYLPADKEADMKEFVQSVLSLMEANRVRA